MRVTSRDSPTPNIDYIRRSPGIYLDMIIHDFDMLRNVTGKDPVELFAYGTSFFKDIGDCGDVDNVMVSLKYADGMIASIDCSRFSAYGYDQRVEVFGELGMVTSEN